MPFKVLIVDDEPMIRRGIASCIDWANEGFELVGEASNGEAALQSVGRQEIDILITDIKMPLMDGLELTRRISVLHPDIQVILISSYSDFEYAREAVKLGAVVDYLLKPTMEPEQLLQLLKTCRSRLEALASRESTAVESALETVKAKRIELQERLKKLLRSEAPAPLEGEPGWLREPLVVAVWKPDIRAIDESGYSIAEMLRFDSARERLGRWLENGVAFKTFEDEFVLVMADRGSGFAAVEQLQKRLSEEERMVITVGVSPVFHRPEGLSAAYGWARQALDNRFYGGKNRCYAGKISASPQAGSEVDLAGEAGLDQWAGLRERFSQGLAAAREEASAEALRRLISLWDAGKLSRQTVMRQAEDLLTLMWTWRFRHNTEEMVGRIVDKLLEVRQLDTLKELTAVIDREFRMLWEAGKLPVVAADSGSAHAVQLAIAYVQQHYRRELSLQEVADHIHMSRNYFSEQFKRLTGLNFIDFVIQLRIHYAKRLLLTTSRRVQEIGALSGFNSPKHFLKLFKREVNCTPVEYRLHAAFQPDRPESPSARNEEK